MNGTSGTRCDRCDARISDDEAMRGWPVTVCDGDGHEAICPDCYGDGAYCEHGHLGRADAEHCDVCEALLAKRLTWAPCDRCGGELPLIDGDNDIDAPSITGGDCPGERSARGRCGCYDDDELDAWLAAEGLLEE